MPKDYTSITIDVPKDNEIGTFKVDKKYSFAESFLVVVQHPDYNGWIGHVYSANKGFDPFGEDKKMIAIISDGSHTIWTSLYNPAFIFHIIGEF